MKIYIDNNHKVLSVDEPIEGLTEVEVPEDNSFNQLSKTQQLCCCYDEGSWWYRISLDFVDILNEKQKEIDSLNLVIDKLTALMLEK